VCRSPLPGVGRENPPTWWYEFKGSPRGQIDGNRADRRYPRDPVITTADVLLKVRRLSTTFYRTPCIHDDIYYDLFYANLCSRYPSTDANGTSSGEYVGLSSSCEVTVASVDRPQPEIGDHATQGEECCDLVQLCWMV